MLLILTMHSSGIRDIKTVRNQKLVIRILFPPFCQHIFKPYIL